MHSPFPPQGGRGGGGGAHLHQQCWAPVPEHGALVHEARPPLAEGVVDDEPLLVREEVVALGNDLVRVGAARLANETRHARVRQTGP